MNKSTQHCACVSSLLLQPNRDETIYSLTTKPKKAVLQDKRQPEPSQKIIHPLSIGLQNYFLIIKTLTNLFALNKTFLFPFLYIKSYIRQPKTITDMKNTVQAVEFPTTVKDRSVIKIPEQFRKYLLQSSQKVRIIMLIDNVVDEDSLWNQMSTEQFFAGYSESDSIYDKL